MIGMVSRLLLKAFIPLALLVGSLSYALYMQGGDPAALLARIAGGAVDDMAASGHAARSVAVDAVDSLATRSSDSGRGADMIHTWVDENGTRHFSDRPDVTADAERVALTPDRNLIRALPPRSRDAAGAPPPVGRDRTTIVRDPRRTDVTRDGVPAATAAALPGIADIAIPDGPQRDVLLDLLR